MDFSNTRICCSEGHRSDDKLQPLNFPLTAESVFVLFVRQLRDGARGKMDTVLAVENSNDISLDKEMLSNMKH